ncbi:triglyceride lipase activity (Partial), partial [Seminavis robusta]|eukprot:Sro3627_g349810.1 triglyceride lipase activity (301) ;mRNA; r:2-905
MPAIYLFQRRTLYGGDDLHVLALMTATARLAQLLCYSVLAYHGQHHVSSFAQGGRGLQGGTMQLGISTLEFGWMDAWEQRQAEDRSLQDNNSNNDCDHWFPFLLTSYTMAGIVFGVASLLLLARIYQVSSQGCPTIHRHPRTERMQQLLEWLFLPLNILHFLVWLVGMAAMSYAYSFEQQRDECHSTTCVSTFFTVLWIASGILLLLSQAIEIVWNALYVFVLYYNDPHAMIWTPNSNNNSSSSLLLHSQSYHHQSSSNTITNSDTTLQPPIQTYYDNHALVEQMWSDRCHNCCQWLGLGT